MSILKGACTDWTSYVENNRPNCLILMRIAKSKEQTDLDRLFLTTLELIRMRVCRLSGGIVNVRPSPAIYPAHGLVSVLCISRIYSETFVSATLKSSPTAEILG